MLKVNQLLSFSYLTLLAISLSSCNSEKTSNVSINKIQELQEFATTKYVGDVIVSTSAEHILLSDSKLLYIARGDVKAGLDLSQLADKDIQTSEDEKKITIKLPSAKILDQKIDVNQSKAYSYQQGILNFNREEALDLQKKAMIVAEDKIVEAACEAGILKTADDNAQASIKKMVETIGNYQDVEVQIGEKQPCKKKT